MIPIKIRWKLDHIRLNGLNQLKFVIAYMYSIHKHFETNSDSLCTSWALFNLHKSVVFLKYANCIYFQICKFIETRMWMWMCMSVCVYHHHHFASGYTNRLKCWKARAVRILNGYTCYSALCVKLYLHCVQFDGVVRHYFAYRFV